MRRNFKRISSQLLAPFANSYKLKRSHLVFTTQVHFDPKPAILVKQLILTIIFLCFLSRRRQPCKSPDQGAVTRPLMSGSELTQPSHPSDPVEMRRLNFQTPAMISHPPIPISELANHIERLKTNDNLKFSQEYEVSVKLDIYLPISNSTKIRNNFMK